MLSVSRCLRTFWGDHFTALASLAMRCFSATAALRCFSSSSACFFLTSFFLFACDGQCPDPSPGPAHTYLRGGLFHVHLRLRQCCDPLTDELDLLLCLRQLEFDLVE